MPPLLSISEFEIMLKRLLFSITVILVLFRFQPTEATPATAIGDTEFHHVTIRVSEDGTAIADVNSVVYPREDGYRLRDGTLYYNLLFLYKESLESFEVLSADYVLPDGTRESLEPTEIVQTQFSNLGVRNGLVTNTNISKSTIDRVIELMDDQWACRISFKKKEKGSAYHVRYKHSIHPVLPGYFSWEQIVSSFGYHGDTRYTLIAPKSMGLAFGGNPPKQHYTDGNTQVAEWVYSNELDSLAVKYVSFPRKDTRQYVLFQVANATLLEFMARYDSHYSARDASEDASIASLASQVIAQANANSDLEKTEAIYKWIQRNLAYAYQGLARDGTTPQRPSSLLQQKLGDCKDYAWLMVRMMRSIGIEAYPALLNADKRNTVTLNSPRQGTDHVILYVPSVGRFIDPTSREKSSLDSIQPLIGLTTACSDGKMRVISLAKQ